MRCAATRCSSGTLRDPERHRERGSGNCDAQRVFGLLRLPLQGYPVKCCCCCCCCWAGIVEQVDRSMTDEIMLTWHKSTTATAAPNSKSQSEPKLALRVLLLSMMYRFGVATLLLLLSLLPLGLPLLLCPSILVGHLASRHAAFVSALQILMRSDIYAMLYTFHAI